MSLEFPKFSEEILSGTGSTGNQDKILVRFGTSWCRPCQNLSESLILLQEEKYNIFDVDIEKHPELESKYNIKAYPTCIIFKNGYEFKRFLGIKSIDIIRTHLKQEN